MFLATSARRLALTARPRAPLPTTSIRTLHATRPLAFPAKDTQHKDDLKPMRNEYSKSGSDQESAEMEQAAFDPNQTSPEQESQTANQESGSVGQSASSGAEPNPLEMSPANQGVSQPRDPQEGSAQGSASESKDSASGRQRTSGGGSGPKAGGGKSGGGTSGSNL